MSFTNRTSSSLSSSDVEMRRRATDLSSRTRLSAHFAEIEHAFPKLRVPGPIPTSVSGALSFLGSRNPMPVPITKRDTVWVFDNTAYRSRKGGGWEAEFVTAAFEQEPKTSIADFVATVAEKIGLADDDDVSRDVIADRIEPFLLEILPGRRVHATHNPGKRGERQLRLGPTGRNGISSDIRYLSHHAEDGDKLLTVADVPKGANGLLEGKTTYAGPEGWAVISGMSCP